MSFMWADALLAAERAHLIRLLAWGAASVLAGTALLAWITIRQTHSSLLSHFAIQTAGWGLAEIALAAFSFHGLAVRDLAGATRLDRILWLNIGLDGGYQLVGLTCIVIGWQLGRRLGLVGAGTAIVVQGMALALLDLVLATIIYR